MAEGQITTTVNKTIDMGTKVLPAVEGSTFNLGAIEAGATQMTTTTTTNQTGFGVEGPGLATGSGAVGYGTTSVNVGNAGATSTDAQFGVEGSAFPVQGELGYGTTSVNIGNAGVQIGAGETTTTTKTTITTTTTGNQLASTISPSFLPDAYNSVEPQQIMENN